MAYLYHVIRSLPRVTVLVCVSHDDDYGILIISGADFLDVVEHALPPRLVLAARASMLAGSGATTELVLHDEVRTAIEDVVGVLKAKALRALSQRERAGL